MKLSQSFIKITLIVLLFAACSPAKKERLDDAPRRIELLFLGHEIEHHKTVLI